MKLTQLYGKELFVNKTSRGVCLGIGISLHSRAVKYLFCARHITQKSVDFAVGISSVVNVEEQIRLARLRPVYPKNCDKIAIGLPIYSFEGVYLGEVVDLEMKNFIATKLFTSRNEQYPVTAVFACSDAVILKKEQAYPLGQRIPAPILSRFSLKSDVVTKTVLRSAIQSGRLVRLTLSLPPFHLTE
ncbi:MAG: hypothetical protein IKZ28_06115 [Clostridia bacterium]|nr:hypothetical protein [Clostridia bacterium]